MFSSFHGERNPSIKDSFLVTIQRKKVNFFTLNDYIVPTITFGQTMKAAMDEVAEYFVKSALKIESGEELEIVNYSNKSHDKTGKRLETELYFALERQFPDLKLFLGKGNNPSREIYLSGTYEQQRDKTIVRLRITKDNGVIAQIEKQYKAKVSRRVVLDLEAETMNPVQRKAFSDIFWQHLMNRIFLISPVVRILIK